MPAGLDAVARAILIGVGATIILDLWGAFAARTFAMPAANWGMVGRWLAGLPRGRFVRNDLGDAPRVCGEQTIGWAAHYITGIVYALLLIAIFGVDWTRHPTPIPAFTVGLLAMAAPFFIMQPGMGLGIAASKAPNPNLRRINTVLSHMAFSAGLYVSAWLLARLIST